MPRPETRYARNGDVHLAYQIVGEGPLDLVYVPGFINNLDLQWEHPGHARLLSRLAAFSRLILFDKPVRRQPSRDRPAWLRSGGFLAHRNPQESEDESEILRPRRQAAA